jgi:acyl-CoA synthetase (AMP-forming)/AMP-acid ligase II
MSLSRVIEHHADRFADVPALSLARSVITYGELRDRACLVAGALRGLGVRRGDVVGLLLYNSIEFVDVMLGTSYLGAICMPLNWRLAPPELAYIVDHSGAAVVVADAELTSLVEPAFSALSCPHFVQVGGVAENGWDGLSPLLAAADRVETPEIVESNDVMRLMYTSGTTARPKGVMITYGNLDAKCFAHSVELGLGRSDRGLIAGPLYHVGALDLTFTTVLYVGGYQRILKRFDAEEVLDAIEQDHITTLWLAPAMVKRVLEVQARRERDLSSVRVLIDGGEKMPLPLIDRICSAFTGAWFADAYGLTETVSGDTFLNKGEERRKLGSVGKPVFNAEIRIATANGGEASAGEAGEILLRGPKICAGYWRDPDATTQALCDGWFRTGDIGFIDEDGYLYIVDRLKDMILSGGENVASSEVERVLYEHPEVVEAAVIGRPDPKWGEVPIGYVVLRSDAEANATTLLGFCADRLARFKAPKAIKIVDALPRNPSGKVLKRELRDREESCDESQSDG